MNDFLTEINKHILSTYCFSEKTADFQHIYLQVFSVSIHINIDLQSWGCIIHLSVVRCIVNIVFQTSSHILKNSLKPLNSSIIVSFVTYFI